MRRTRIILFSVLIAAGCAKDDPIDLSSNDPVGSPPSVFTKKVLIEGFTGAWCGWCPGGMEEIDKILKTNEDRAVAVEIHYGDSMWQPALYDRIDDISGDSTHGFPTAMVDRRPSPQDSLVVMYVNEFASAVSERLAVSASCGLAIETYLTGEEASVKIHIGFKQKPQDTYYVTAYLVQDSMTGSGSWWDQVNNYNLIDPENYFYHAGNPIYDFKHMHVLREAITNASGDIIPVSAVDADNRYAVTKTVNVSKYDKKNVKIVAFIHKVGDPFLKTHEVMNVQEAKLGEIKSWN